MTIFILLLIIAIFLIRKPEISFVLFLTSGNFKAAEFLESFQIVDITMLFGIVTLTGIIIKYFKSKKDIYLPAKIMIPYLILITVMFISLLYTASPIYGMYKFLKFATITSFALFAPLFIFDEPKTIRRFFVYFIFISVVMVFGSLVTEQTSSFRTAFGSNYLAMSRITGLACIIILTFFLISESRMTKRLFWIILLAINLFGLLSSGGRGSVVATLVVLVLSAIFLNVTRSFDNRKYLDYYKIYIPLVIFSSFLLITYQPTFFSNLLYRVQSVINLVDNSTSLRLDLFRTSINVILSPVYYLKGLGIGGFSSYYIGYDEIRGMYPHNIFLEIGAELGIIGLLSFSILIILSIIYLIKISNIFDKNYYLYAFVFFNLLTYMLLNSSISGDINDNRMLFTAIGSIYSLKHLLNHKNV